MRYLRTHPRFTCTLIGMLIGAFIGSSFGIAGFGDAIAGTLPGAILFGFLGWFAADKWRTTRMLRAQARQRR